MGELTKGMRMSVDHVYNFADYERHAGNLLLAHEQCNFEKSDRHPTYNEQKMLGLVNRCLQYCKGYYRTVPPPAARGKIAKDCLPKAFVIHELTPSDFFFKMLTEISISLKLKLNERLGRDTI
jgi:hypothetical protein